MCLKHGLGKHKLYKVYLQMRQKCSNPNDSDYKNYGARGISVCPQWDVSFIAFFNWAIDNGYQEGLTIDRIDVNGNYEPLNCRWATKRVQAINRRVMGSVKYKGVDYIKRENRFRSRICVNYKVIVLGAGFKTAEEARDARVRYIKEKNLEYYTD